MIESTVQGIPCLINVTHFERVVGQGMSAASDIDCYGYTEIEYKVCDRNGYTAKWLETKMTEIDREQIESDILDYYGKEED